MRHPQFVRRNIKPLILATVALLVNFSLAAPPSTINANAALNTRKLLGDPEAWVAGLVFLPPQGLTPWRDDAAHNISSLITKSVHAIKDADQNQLLDVSNDIVHFFNHHEFDLPKNSVLIYDPETRSLAAYTTAGALLDLMNYSSMFPRNKAISVQISLDVFEINRKNCQEILDDFLVADTHASTHKKLTSWVREGKAKILTSQSSQTLSGQRLQLKTGQEHQATSGFYYIDADSIEWIKKPELAGTLFEADIVVGPDRNTIDCSYHFRHHLTPPGEWLKSATTQNQPALEVPMIEYTTVSCVGSVNLKDKEPQILNTWFPAGNNSVVHIAMATPRINSLDTPQLNQRLLSFLQELTAKDSEIDRIKRVKAPKEMVTSRFRAPIDFMPAQIHPSEVSSDAPLDPFAPVGSNDRVSAAKYFTPTLKVIFTQSGVTFPEGSYAYFDPNTGLIQARNNQANLEAIDAYLSSIRYDPPVSLSFTMKVVEASSDTLQKIIAKNSSAADHAHILQHIKSLEGTGDVQTLQSLTLRCRSGSGTLIHAGKERSLIKKVQSGKARPLSNNMEESRKADNLPVVTRFMAGELGDNKTGTAWAIEPILEPDGVMLDINIHLSHNDFPPINKETTLAPFQPKNSSSIDTSFLMRDRTTRMFYTWSTDQKDSDRIRAAFLQVATHRNSYPLGAVDRQSN